MNLRTETGFMGRCVQDVVTKPSKKTARIQFEQGSVDWICGVKPNIDEVIIASSEINENRLFHKRRPDDFIDELKHINSVIVGEINDSPISLKFGLETMLVIAACHLSNKLKRNIRINYDYGCKPDSLNPI